MKFLSKNLASAIAACGLWLGAAFSGLGANANVTVAPGGTYTFSPSVVSINAGDQVTWTWADTTAPHTTTSGSSCTANGLWDNSSGTSFSYTFTNAGTYPYFCVPHCIYGMTGEVIVNAVSVPSVSITSPANGAVFAAPANVNIKAAASDTGGTITNVQFRVGSTVLTNEAAGPFAVTANISSAGSNTLSAIASDSGGIKATNSVMINVVTPSPLALGAAARSGANFKFMYTADAGLSYFVQRSTNLVSTNWQTLATNTASGSSVNFTDVNATVNPGFYRVGRVPNP